MITPFYKNTPQEYFSSSKANTIAYANTKAKSRYAQNTIYYTYILNIMYMCFIIGIISVMTCNQII